HRDVAGLPGEARACASRQHRCAVSPADGHRSNYVVSISGDDETDGNLPVIGSVGCIERAASSIEPDLAADLALQRGFQLGPLRKDVDGFRVRAEWKWSGHEVGRIELNQELAAPTKLSDPPRTCQTYRWPSGSCTLGDPASLSKETSRWPSRTRNC